MPCKSLFAITLCLFALPALADVPVAQLPYTQLLGYQQRVDDLQDLKQLKANGMSRNARRSGTKSLVAKRGVRKAH